MLNDNSVHSNAWERNACGEAVTGLTKATCTLSSALHGHPTDQLYVAS